MAVWMPLTIKVRNANSLPAGTLEAAVGGARFRRLKKITRLCSPAIGLTLCAGLMPAAGTFWRAVLIILKALIILIIASGLEVGGDALIRLGLGGATYAMAAGALTLFAYGLVVNKCGLDFNRLMGVYIAIFFLVSQVISFILFKQIPDDRILLGGGFIVTGGLLILVMT